METTETLFSLLGDIKCKIQSLQEFNSLKLFNKLNSLDDKLNSLDDKSNELSQDTDQLLTLVGKISYSGEDNSIFGTLNEISSYIGMPECYSGCSGGSSGESSMFFA
jgi:hypothetical protein